MYLEHGQEHAHKLIISHDPYKTGKTYFTDVLFPQEVKGIIDTWGIDEGAAAMLKGFVMALKPEVILETGTHRGRSTRALAEAVHENMTGHIWTVDMDDYGLMTEGALREHEKTLVTQVVGKTPEILSEDILGTLRGIEFAFLDGDHTPEGIEAELEYVRQRQADECLVLVDNSRDEGWPDEKKFFENFPKENAVSLQTMCGMHLIRMVK
jgi:predicted O-methyltransferase YrrM